MGRSSKHTLQWTCQISDTVIKWSQAIFDRKIVTMNVFQPLSPCNIQVHLKIFEYFLRSIKKSISKTENFKLFKVCSFMHSILGRGSFSTNFSISEEWHGSDQHVALLSLQLVWIVGLTVSHLSLENIPYIPYGVQVRHVSWPIKQCNIMVSKALGSGFGTVGRC